MRRKKELRRRFGMLAIICAIGAIISLAIGAYITGYNYAAMECNISHGGASAPASVAFISAIPYAAVTLVLSGGFAFCYHKSKKRSAPIQNTKA